MRTVRSDWLRRLLCLALAASTTSCAARRIRAENALALAAADARVLEGCYDCLLEAKGTYEQLAKSKYLEPDSIAQLLFETELLIALRERELALDWRPTLERATALVPRVPRGLDANRLLELVRAVTPDATGRPTWAARQRRGRDFVTRVPEHVAWVRAAPMRPVVRDYLALALDCSYDGRVHWPNMRTRPQPRRSILTPGMPPIIAYRVGTCIGSDTIVLAGVRRDVPRFVETSYWTGSFTAMTAESDGGVAADSLLEAAYDRFPRAPGVVFMLGFVGTLIGDCVGAIARFDETLAIDSTFEGAVLQRTICLSGLHRDTAAIASATRLIDMAGESLDQGFYWRALSRHRLKDLPAARADINFAKQRSPDASNVLTLAGVIEHDQADFAVAEKDLRGARELVRGDQNCTAAYYLGLVLNKTSRARASGEQFQAAMDCYDVQVWLLRTKIQQAQAAAERNPEFAARRVASLAADSSAKRSLYWASAFNAAGNMANAGDLARATQLLDIAASDPALADKIAIMRAAIRSVR
jgi:hypothetical protein